MEVEQNQANLSAEDKLKYLFLKQINTLNAFRKRNAISCLQIISKMGITEEELQRWL